MRVFRNFKKVVEKLNKLVQLLKDEELENIANDLSKLQKGKFHFTISPYYLFDMFTPFLPFPSKSTIFFVDIAKNHQVRKKYTIQLGENELVLKVPFNVFCGKNISFYLFANHQFIKVFILPYFTDCFD